jgi:hypothetical protein
LDMPVQRCRPASVNVGAIPRVVHDPGFVGLGTCGGREQLMFRRLAEVDAATLQSALDASR